MTLKHGVLYLCNLCGNNSHDGYDCQQQFLFVHEQELSYNQNYDETSDKVFQANHSIQNKESFKNPSDEIAVSSSNPEKPPQDSDIFQLIREECCVEASGEQKQSMEDTMLELVKICQEKEFLCIHDDVNDLIESALNSKFLLINSNSQCLEKEQEEVKNVVEHPAERGNHNIQSLQNFRDGNSQQEEIDVVTETDDVLPSSVENDNDSLNDPLLEEVDLFLSDNSIPPGIENVTDDPEGDIQPPDAGEEIPVVMNDKYEDDDYSYFIIVIFDKKFSLLFAKSEDTIFDP
nr:hypothetical protein [Tanacetum cinerariifolium]